MKFNHELIGYCGFYCGSCPTLVRGDCAGCLKAHKKGDCFTNDCVKERKLRFCGQCPEFPCNEVMTREKATVLDPRWLAWKRSERTGPCVGCGKSLMHNCFPCGKIK